MGSSHAPNHSHPYHQEVAERQLIKPAHTLHGQLQRGRGAGFLRGLTEPVEDLQMILVDCITNDPRWDPQLEIRAGYYADLAVAIRLDPAPLSRHLEEHDDDTAEGWKAEPTVQTLGIMAARGRTDAATILRRYSERGFWWHHAVEWLAQAGQADGALMRLSEKRLAAMPPGESGWHIPAFAEDEPWTTWIPHSSVIRQWFREEERSRQQPSRSTTRVDESASTEALLASATGRNWLELGTVLRGRASRSREVLLSAAATGRPEQRAAALRALEGTEDERVFDLATASYFQSGEIMPGLRVSAIRTLERLPAEMTLPAARIWFHSDDPWERKAGASVLGEHATVEDLPLLSEAVGPSLADRDEYRVSGILDALARHPLDAPLDVVELAFKQTTYTWNRRRAAEFLAQASRAFSRNLAFECLWDCEEELRAIGCVHVDPSVLGATRRIAELAGDELEEDDVRAVAHDRLWTEGQ